MRREVRPHEVVVLAALGMPLGWKGEQEGDEHEDWQGLGLHTDSPMK